MVVFAISFTKIPKIFSETAGKIRESSVFSLVGFVENESLRHSSRLSQKLTCVFLILFSFVFQAEEDSAAAPPAASTRAQKRSAQAQPNSSKKKSKRARGGRPSRAAAQKDTQMSLEVKRCANTEISEISSSHA